MRPPVQGRSRPAYSDPWNKIMSKSWGKGGTRAWRKRRAQVLADNQRASGGRCRLAVADVCTLAATQVHHVRGRAATGDDPRWLVASCRPCNLHVGDPQQHPATCPCGWGLHRPRVPQPKRVSRW